MQIPGLPSTDDGRIQHVYPRDLESMKRLKRVMRKIMTNGKTWTVVVLLIACLAIGLSTFGFVSYLWGLIAGIISCVVCFLIASLHKGGYDEDYSSAWLILAVLIFPLCFFLTNLPSFKGIKSSSLLSALSAGFYEEGFVRVIPLMLILLGVVEYRKTLMVLTSIIFGVGHVVANVGTWQWSVLWLGNFFGKITSSTVFGLILAIVIVKMGKYGILVAPLAHALSDLLVFVIFEHKGTASYLQGNAWTSYLKDIFVMLIAVAIIEAIRWNRARKHAELSKSKWICVDLGFCPDHS